MATAPPLADYRRRWDAKPATREIYGDIYRRLLADAPEGPLLEIGSGSGNMRAARPDLIATDILEADWLSAVCDAQRLPFADNSFAAVAMVDVLHHIERPVRFLREAARVLRPGGRLLLCEPAITPLSYPVYKWAHPEPVDMRADPLADGPIDPGKDPYMSNQAIPTLLFRRRAGRRALAEAVPELRLVRTELLSLWAYLLSGGFQNWSLLPRALVRPILALEDALLPLLGPLGAFRLIAVLEKAEDRS